MPRRLIKNIFVAFFLASCLLSLGGSGALADELKVKPINLQATDLGVQLPDLQFSPPIKNGPTITIPYLSQYIAAVYRYLIGISVVLAIIMVMWGGFRYLIGSTFGDVKAGKKIIADAVAGLVVLFGAYFILQTVNPATTALDALTIQLVEETSDQGDVIPVAPPTPAPAPQPAQPPTPQPFPTPQGPCKEKAQPCTDVASCTALCKQPQSAWPTCSPSAADPTAVILIPNNLPGIKNVGAKKAVPELVDALKIAGQEAADQGYIIYVTSGWRPVQRQIAIVCDEINRGRQQQLGHGVAYPGSSMHETGHAIDVQLRQGSNVLVCSGTNTKCLDTQSDPKYKEPAKILLKIMTDAGFHRYSKEIWHFEYHSPVTISCRCSFDDCPWPPTRC